MQEVNPAFHAMSNYVPEEPTLPVIQETHLYQHKRNISEGSDEPTKDSWKKAKDEEKDNSQNLEGNLDHAKLEGILSQSSIESSEMSSSQNEKDGKQVTICKGCGKTFKNILLHFSKNKDDQNCEKKYTSDEIDDFNLSKKNMAA